MATKKHSEPSSPAAKTLADTTIPHDKIAMRAYEKWRERGCPPGSDQRIWFEAEAEIRAELVAARGRSGRRGVGSTAMTSPIPAKSLKQQRELASLEEKLHDDDTSVREDAIGKLAFFGEREGVLLIISALDDSSPRVRAQARECFFATYREFPFSPNVRERLESNQSALRREAMREIVMCLPQAKEAIHGRFPGWQTLLPLTRTTETPNPSSPQDKVPSSAGREPVMEDLEMMKQTESPEAACDNPQKFLIRIPEKTDRVKAITAFRRVRATRVTLPGNVMGVNDEHIRVLERENIPFEYVSKAPNGKSTSV